MALERVLRECRNDGIDVLPVKGVLTGRLLYADAGLRPIQDVDLRIRPRDLARIETAGRRAGWRMVFRSRAYQSVSFDVLGFLVELESHVGPPGLCGLTVEDMIARAVPATSPLGFPHLQPEIHDHALLLCVNAFKDKLVEARPGAIRDLELLPRQEGFDPQRLIALAREAGSASILWIVATWLAAERGSEGWSEIRKRLGATAPRPLYSWLFDQALRAAPRSHQVLRPLARVGADSPMQWFRALYAMADEVLMGARSNAARLRRNKLPVVTSGKGEVGQP